jgi:uncharacterized membrane protein
MARMLARLGLHCSWLQIRAKPFGYSYHARVTAVVQRIDGIDVARGFASAIMIQGHAYDGWASPEAKETAFYAFTRVLGSLPLPAFLVLSGASLALRVEAASRRDEDAKAVRAAVVRRGVEILLVGYVSSGVYALIDGADSIATVLRADVLHLIGLSIAIVGWLGIGASRVEPRRLGIAALGVGTIVLAVCPWASQATGGLDRGMLRFVVGLFSEVPDITRMPFIPLAAWFCLGIGTAQLMIRERARARDTSAAGAPSKTLFLLGGTSLAIAVAGHYLTGYFVDHGVALTRHHPIVWLNAIDLGARGVLVLAVGAFAANFVTGRTRTVLVRLGRGSLVAYVFHIPFCYGTLASPFAFDLDMWTATLLVTILIAMSVAAVFVRDAFRARERRQTA